MKFLLVSLMGMICLPVFAQSVVATNGWTAAYATAAGAGDVLPLAPYESAHPPEYELRPSDLLAVAAADLVIFAGYEVMVDRLLEAIGRDTNVGVRIVTGYSLDQMQTAIETIATRLGTEDEAAESVAEINSLLSEWSADLAGAGVNGKRVLAHFHQQGLAREIGLNVVGVFGPAPLQAHQIAELTALDPDLIIDNGHNPISAPIAETTGAKVSTWINFPGTEGTRSLIDVIGYNRAQLTMVSW